MGSGITPSPGASLHPARSRRRCVRLFAEAVYPGDHVSETSGIPVASRADFPSVLHPEGPRFLGVLRGWFAHYPKHSFSDLRKQEIRISTNTGTWIHEADNNERRWACCASVASGRISSLHFPLASGARFGACSLDESRADFSELITAGSAVTFVVGS